jgi:hypothetical protein
LGAPGDEGKAMALDIVEERFLKLLNSKAEGLLTISNALVEW